MRLITVQKVNIIKSVCRTFSLSSRKILYPVTHVIFDMDGVLLDTENIHKKAVSDVVAKFGKIYDLDLRYRVLGAPEIEGAKMVVNELQLDISVNHFIEMVHKIEENLLPHVNILPGVERFLQHLHDHGIPFAIATSSSKESYEIKTSKHKDLFSLFNHVVTGASDTEVKLGKPAPDIFLTCASRFNDKPNPRKCIVFEDSPNGVRGAIAAGMQVVMLPDPLLPKELCTEATIIVNSMNDFCPEIFGLPNIEF